MQHDLSTKNFFRQSMAWLHAWVGLLIGWVLYFMFITYRVALALGAG